MATKGQIDSFYEFASHEISNGGSDKPIDETYDEWCDHDRQLDDLAAIRDAVEDYKNGERGRDSRNQVDELRGKLDVARDA